MDAHLSDGPFDGRRDVIHRVECGLDQHDCIGRKLIGAAHGEFYRSVCSKDDQADPWKVRGYALEQVDPRRTWAQIQVVMTACGSNSPRDESASATLVTARTSSPALAMLSDTA